MLKTYRAQVTILFLIFAAFVTITASTFKTSASSQELEEIQYIQPENETALLPLVEDRQVMADLKDGFEQADKTTYAAEYVLSGSGLWYMENARIGRSEKDHKAEGKAVRLKEDGILRMEFDQPGAGAVTISHAVYGEDGPSTWELWYSTDSGQNYMKAGSEIYTVSTTLQTATFVFNTASPIRFKIVKATGGSNRVDIDNITITGRASKKPPLYAATTIHLTMGNPSNAVASTSFPTNYLMEKTQYSLSYNRNRATPNWTSWHLGLSDLGSAPRQDDFRADTTLPTGWYRVTGSSYSGSGYDRGHMCPSGDRTDTVTNNSATFLMTNMIPQAPDNNQGPWASLEDYTRNLVRSGNECYIISGSYGSNGTINNGNIVVPTRTWKVIVVLPNGSSDVSRVTTSTRVIAVNMPNSNGIRSVSWKNYRVSVDSIEAATGYNLLSNVSSSVQSVIESRVDNVP